MPPTSTYVGEPACTKCHEARPRNGDSRTTPARWRLRDETVLGNFDNATFTHAGVTSSFSRRDGKFFVRTDGPDGALHDYEVKYIFGYRPLQQYLIEFPGGRYQCLTIAWDSRPKAQGGQRWFHLYPGETIAIDGSPALDRAEPELELHVRRLPLDQPAAQLRPRHEHLQDDVV